MRKIIVTGVSQGIGEAITLHLKNLNYEIIGIDLNKSSNCHQFFQGDLADTKFLDTVVNSLPSDIYAIVHNAAIQVEKTCIDTSYEELEKVFKVNLFAPFYLSSRLFNKMSIGGAIIHISSVHAKATSPSISAYAASKGALSALTRSMALELSSKKIRVNAILPGAIDTPMLQKGLERNGNKDESLEKLKSQSPLKQIGNGKDIANLCSFLIDENLSGNITGQEFICDSGVLARLPSE